MKDDRVYLSHVLRCIARIEGYTAGGRSAFFASHLIQDGVIRNLQTLAESSQRLSDGIKASRPEVDWRSCPAFETSWCTTTRVLISTLCFASSNTTCRG